MMIFTKPMPFNLLKSVKRFSYLNLFIIAFLLISSDSFSQTVLASSAGEAATITAGQTDVAILAINVSKTSGSPDISGVAFTFDTSPLGTYTNLRLYHSTNDIFTLADTQLGGAQTVTSTQTYSFSFTAFAIGGGAGEYFFIVADIDPNISSSTSIGTTVSSSQITSTGTESGSATGPTYDSGEITQWTAAIADIVGETASPLVPGTTEQAVFGFSLGSNGTQTVSQLNVQLTSNPASKLSNWQLVTSADAVFDGTGTDMPIGGLTFDASSGTQVVITGLSQNISGTTINYYLLADVAATPTGTIQASLGTTNVTVNQGQKSGTATGPNYGFLTTVVAPLTLGIATPPLIAGSTDQAILGFSLSSGGTQTVDELTIQLTNSPASILSNWRLVSSTDTDFDGVGTDMEIGGLTYDDTSGDLIITGLSEAISSAAKNYFLVVDVDALVNSMTTQIQPSLVAADVSVDAGAVSGSATGTNYSFAAVTATIATNNGALTNVVGGNTNKAIFGFTARTNGTQSMDSVVFTITTGEPLSNILTSFVLKNDGANATYSGAGATLGAVAVSGSGPYVLKFDLNSSPVVLSGTDTYFYLVANSPGAAPATVGVQAALTHVGVNAGSTSSLAGFSRTFNVEALTATIATNNGALTNIVAGNTNKAIFGFTARTNGTQSMDSVVFTITTGETLSNILTSFVLKNDGANTTYSGAGATIGAVAVSGSGPYVLKFDLNSSPVVLSGTDTYFYLVANSPGAAPATVGVQAALTHVGVNTGSTTSLAGFSRTFNVEALTATIATNNGALTNVVGGDTNKAIFGFTARTNDTQSMDSVVFTITTGETLSNILTSFVLKNDGANATYSGAGATLGAVAVTGSGPYVLKFDLNSSPVVLSGTDTYFYLVANSPGAAPNTVGVQAALTHVGVNAGSTSSLAGFSRTFDIEALTTTITQLTGGVGVGGTTLANRLEAGSGSPLNSTTSANAILGFTLDSNGGQTVDAIRISFDTDPTNKFSALGIRNSTNNTTFEMATDALLASTQGATLGAGPFTITLTLSSPLDISTAQNLFIVASIDDDQALQSTTPIIPSIDDVDFTLTPSNITPITTITGNTYYFTQSYASDIILNGGNTANINITDANTSDETPGEALTTANSSILATFTLRDGGAGDDKDDLPTILDGLTISVENFANLDQIALFDHTDTKIASTDKTPAATVNWTGLNYATSTDRSGGASGTRNFTIRASFKTVVTDNQQTDIDIIATTSAAGTASLLAATNAGGAGTSSTGNHNQTEVNATKLVFVDPADLPITNTVTPYTGPIFATVEAQPNDQFDATVAAVDDNNNIDLDRTTSITLTTNPAATLKDDYAAIAPIALSGGIITFTNLTINSADSYELRAAGSGLTSATGGTALEVTIQSAGVAITAPTKTMCKSDGGEYQLLGDIVLAENDQADFGTGSLVSFLLILPSGWEFDTNQAGTISYTASQNISFAETSFTFLGNTIGKFSYTVTNTNKTDQFTFSDLWVRNTGGIDGVITRGGTGVIKGCCDDDKHMGTLNTSPTAVVSFSVKEYPGQPALNPATELFPRSSKAIILEGEVPAGATPDGTIGTYSGSGVNVATIPDLGSRYTFNPSILDPDQDYDVTFTYAAPVTGCVSDSTRTFHVYGSAIDNLATFYCSDDITPKPIKVNPILKPMGTSVILDPDTAFSIRIPTYKYIREILNNGGTLTLSIPNHGFTNGQQYWIYIANSINQFTGVDAPYGYIYKQCTVSNATIDEFDINVDVVGDWDKYYGIVYLPDNYYVGFNGSTINTTTTITVNTSIEHGYLAGARPYCYLSLYDPNTATYIYREGFFTISNVTATSYRITLPGGLAVPLNATYSYGYSYSNWFRVTSFVPNLTLLNSKLSNVSAYTVGYFIRYDGCTDPYCYIYNTIHDTPVNFFPAPTTSFTGLAVEYCKDDDPVTLTSLELTGVYSIVDAFGSTDRTDIVNFANTGTATFAPTDNKGDTLLAITYTYTDLNGCKAVFTDSTIIQSKLPIPIANDTTFCQFTSGPFRAKAMGTVSGAVINWYPNSFLDPIQVLAKSNLYDATETLNPSTTSTNTYYATQEAEGFCESPATTVILEIVEAPSATFVPPPPCEDRQFTLTGPNGTVAAPIDTWQWDFGEVGGTANTQVATYTYTTTGQKKISLTTSAVGGCSNSSFQIVGFVQNPDADFKFDQNCFGNNTHFEAIPDPGFTISSYAWDFGEGAGREPNMVSVDNYNTFAAEGEFTVWHWAYDNNNCYDSISRKVPILHKVTGINSQNPYILADADPLNEKGYWVVEDAADSTTWEFAPVNKQIILGPVNPNLAWVTTNPVWITNASGNYKAKDISYVNSPCFDLSDPDLTRPLISLDYISNTREVGYDGAVLEYSVNGGVSWVPLGNTSTGIGWYNNNGFTGSIVGATNTFGWSGNLFNVVNGLPEWLEARHKLDGITPKNNLRFRIAFGSNSDAELSGFAFTNLKIENRNRLVLIENFTNENKDATYTGVTYAENKTAYDNIGPLESLKVQYHLNWPSEDTNSKLNLEEQTARMAYYGVVLSTNSIPRTFIDGSSNGDITGVWATTLRNKKELSPAPIELKVITEPAETGYLKAKVSIKALLDIPKIPANRNIVSRIALVEKTDVSTNQNVFRRFISSPIGFSLYDQLSLLSGETIVYSDSILVEELSVLAANLSDLALVAFVQDDSTKEVYQADILLDPDFTSISPITSIEDPAYASKITLYPNAANQEVNIVLPNEVTKTTPVSMLDAYGKEVYQNYFSPGQKRKVINTTDMAAGMYIIRITTPEGGVATKKVMVVH
jgi:hypothetical protein